MTGGQGSSFRSGRSSAVQRRTGRRGRAAPVERRRRRVPRSSSRAAARAPRRGCLLDLEAHGATEAAAAQLHLDGGEQVVGLLLLERQVGVAGDPERAVLVELHAGEQLGELRGDHLLERDEAVRRRAGRGSGAAAAAPSPGRSAARPVSGSRTITAEVQREVGDVGERMAGVDGERREDREDPLLEDLDRGTSGRRRRARPSATARCPLRRAPARSSSPSSASWSATSSSDAVRDRQQLLGRRAAVGRRGR